jgi:plastocyanin
MKKDSKKAHESHQHSDNQAEDLTNDLKTDLKELVADAGKESNKTDKTPETPKTNLGTTIIVLVILAILVVIVGFVIKANLEGTIQNNNLTNTLVQINTNYVIDISKLGFIPTIVEINKGDTVIWKNQNFSSHKIVFDVGDMSGFDIDKLSNYSITFNEPGTYEYHSVTQIYMKGKISVSP